MAVFNEMQIGRFNAILAKLLNMKDQAPAPALSSDLSAGITLESERPEWEFLSGSRILTALVQSGPVAAQISQAQIFNPVGSGVLVVLERILVHSSAATAFTVNRTAVLAAASGGGSSRDFRLPTGQQSSARVTGVTPAGASVQVLGQMSFSATGDICDWDIPIVIAPGTGVNVNGTIVNLAINCTFIWRERVLELSELR